MKISNSTSNYINKAYTPPKPAAANSQQLNTDNTVKEPQTDSIILSDKTRDIQKIAKASEVTSPDRQKMIDQLKQQVQQNQYTVDADKVAEKMTGAMIDGII